MNRLTACLLSLVACACFADEDHQSGNYILKICDQAPPLCTFYIGGLIDGFFYGIAYSDKYKSVDEINQNIGICQTDKNITQQQLNDVYIKYLRNHPESRDENSVLLLIRAFKQAWPCH